MDAFDDDGARLLAPLRDAAPAGVSRVDVDDAVRVGARRRRTRQVVSVAAVAAVVAVVLAVVPAVLNGRTESAPARPVPGFDIMRQSLTVGSAGGFTPVSYETGRHRQQVRLVPAPNSPQGTPEAASVTMYASGQADRPSDGEPAPEVYGHRAFWLGSALAWEWAPDAWVVARVEGTGAHVRELARRVALSVRTDGDTIVRVPCTIAPPGGGLDVVGVVTPYGTSTDPGAGALLVLGTRTSPDTRVTVGVVGDPERNLATGERRAAPAPNTELAGRQAAVAETEVLVFGVGSWTAIAESDTGGAALLSRLAGLVTAFGDRADPGTWATEPVR